MGIRATVLATALAITPLGAQGADLVVWWERISPESDYRGDPRRGADTGAHGARAADLVVWWDEGYYAEESEAVAEVITAFEQGSGKQVDLVQHPQDKLPYKIEAALEAGRPPDFAFGFDLSEHDARWAFEGRLVDISTPSATSRTCSIRMRSPR